MKQVGFTSAFALVYVCWSTHLPSQQGLQLTLLIKGLKCANAWCYKTEAKAACPWEVSILTMIHVEDVNNESSLLYCNI